MKLVKREYVKFWQLIPRMPGYAWLFLRCFRLVKKPIRFIKAYIFLQNLPDNYVEFRNGLKVYLSSHPDDVITAFLIFIRKDYGKIPAESTIIDIGANIGMFALYAAQNDARRILAFEPCEESYQLLLKNIEANGFSEIISPNYLVVTDVDGASLQFPKKSSAENSVNRGDANLECNDVRTTNLKAIMNKSERIDLLKMDCEGGEYDILFNADKEDLKKISAIRMEYHNGKVAQLTKMLSELKFALRFHQGDEEIGNLWYEKSESL